MQHIGIYAGDEDSYEDFKDVFEPIILEYHGLPAEFNHTSDMDVDKLQGNIDPEAPVKSTRIRVGRSIAGFGLSPGITKEQRIEVEALMKKAFQKLTGDLAGTYYPLEGMDETVRQKLVDDHFLFMSGDENYITAGMERDWPEGRGIFLNDAKTLLAWINQTEHLKIVAMEEGRPTFWDIFLVFQMIKILDWCKLVHRAWRQVRKFEGLVCYSDILPVVRLFPD